MKTSKLCVTLVPRLAWTLIGLVGFGMAGACAAAPGDMAGGAGSASLPLGSAGTSPAGASGMSGGVMSVGGAAGAVGVGGGAAGTVSMAGGSFGGTAGTPTAGMGGGLLALGGAAGSSGLGPTGGMAGAFAVGGAPMGGTAGTAGSEPGGAGVGGGSTIGGAGGAGGAGDGAPVFSDVYLIMLTSCGTADCHGDGADQDQFFPHPVFAGTDTAASEATVTEHIDEIVRRIHLPESDEEHMPREEPSLAPEDIATIEAWAATLP